MSTKCNTTANLRMLDDVVRALIRRYGITAEEVENPMGQEGRVWGIAFEKATRLKPEALGRIVFAVPTADLYFWHCATWLGKYESGPYLLQQIVATAIICRMRYQLGVSSGDAAARYMHMPHQAGPVPSDDRLGDQQLMERMGSVD